MSVCSSNISTMVKNGFTYGTSILIFTFILIQNLHKGACSFIKEQDSTIMHSYSTKQNQNKNLQQYYYRSTSNNTNIEMIEDDDPNYPYEQILQLVKDTKRIMMSSNETEKNQLNLDRFVYTRYLLGDLSDSFPYAGGPYPPTDDACPGKIEFRIPRRLMGEDDEEYYIVNVGKELKQEYHAIVCRYPRSKCNYSGRPDGYSYFCKTTFNRKRSFVSLPVGNEINLSQQSIRSFLVPDNCVCSGSRDDT